MSNLPSNLYTHKKLRFYTGKDLLILSTDSHEPIIDGMLYEMDYIMLTADPKVGKTIFAQQIACSISSGTKFLNTFDTRKNMVWYFATEGKDEDIKDRFIRMSKYVNVEPDNIVLICCAGLRFNTQEGIGYIKYMLEKYKNRLPKVIIIDALYMSIKGSLKDDESVIDFHTVIRWFSEQCKAAVILVHHMTKPSRDRDGTYFERSDRDSYGSTFLMGAVDHCMWMEKWEKTKDDKDRFIHCDTQRSGNVVEDFRIRLNEPEPLYFTMVSVHDEEKKDMVQLLKDNPNGFTVKELEKKVKYKKSIIYSTLSELVGEGKIEKVGGKGKTYRMKVEDKKIEILNIPSVTI